MDISRKENNTLVITGEMKTIENYETINQGAESVTIEVKDSLTITSSIIGLFTKTVHGDGLKINLVIHSDRLYNLLEDLNLIVVFNVQKAK